MKRKNVADLRNKTVAELDKAMVDLTSQLVKAQQELALHKVKNTNIVKHIRRDLAQMLTIKTERQLVGS